MSYPPYQGPPGQFGQSQGYGGFQRSSGPPPGVGPPSGMAPPGTAGAPGLQHPQQQNSGGLPSNFDPTASMPGVNLSAPVIRLGMQDNKPATPSSAGFDRRGGNAEPVSNRRGMGVGYGDRGNQQRDKDHPNVTLPSQSREEVARTIFIGNVTEAFGNEEQIQSILGVGGGLRKWTRAFDTNQKGCTFGFAEYDNADNLAIAIEVLSDVQVPSKDQPEKVEAKVNGVKKEDGETPEASPTEQTDGMNGEVKSEGGDLKMEEEEEIKPEPMSVDETPRMDTLLVVIDEASQRYIDEWKGRKEQKSEDGAQARQFHVDGAKQDLEQLLRRIAHPADSADGNGMAEHDGQHQPQNQGTETVTNPETGDVVNIAIPVEDELSEIPAEMRETVAQEIAAFRDRSHQRDLERLRQEEMVEAREKEARERTTHLNGNANNVPVGPRSQQAAPTGPRGAGFQIPKDYQKGVTFVNGATMNGVSNFTKEEEESDASDEELERRRQAKQNSELEKQFLDAERKLMNKERSRTAAIEREQERESEEAARREHEKQVVRQRLRDWDDDKEASAQREEYYSDRSAWLRNREIFRQQEGAIDERDRNLEEREKQMDQERRNREAGVADDFLAEQTKVLEQELQKQPTREPMKFKMGLGSASKREPQIVEQATRRSMAALEGLLEDEDDVARRERGNRQLMPIAEDSTRNSGLSAEERHRAARQLALEIPSDRRGLWAWNVKWDYVDVGVMSQLRDFVERKIIEALGVMEERQVDLVEESVKKRVKPQDLVDKLTPALRDEAEGFVKKLWRMLIFLSESEKRGLAD
ncbi:MAG: hypothetical protein Q9162_002438 [Coniocarpon cinnabarinum]